MKHIKLMANIVMIYSVFFNCASTNTESKRSPEYEKCMDSVDLGAFKNSQWASCSDQEIKRQDITLNIEYRKLKKSLSKEQQSLLANAQQSWLKFREDWCKLDEIASSAPGGKASYNFCIIELTEKQIGTIKGLQF